MDKRKPTRKTTKKAQTKRTTKKTTPKVVQNTVIKNTSFVKSISSWLNKITLIFIPEGENLLRKILDHSIYIKSGVILDVENHRYSSTEIHSTRGRDGIDSISSSTHHHQHQKITYRNTKAKIDEVVQLENVNIDAIKRQKLQLINGTITNQIYRFLNMNNERYWRLIGYNFDGPILSKVPRGVLTVIVSFILALVMSIPFISFLNVFHIRSFFKPDDFGILKQKLKVILITIITLSILSYLPFFISSSPDFGISKKTKFKKKSLTYKGVKAFSGKRGKGKKKKKAYYRLLRKKIFYINLFKTFLFWSLFLFYVLKYTLDNRIHKVLDDVSIARFKLKKSR